MIDDFRRIVRFKDLEVWDIKISKDIYRMCIYDENRPATAADLNLPQGIEIEDDELRENLITVKVYSKSQVKEEHISF